MPPETHKAKEHSMNDSTWRSRIRVIWAIAAKDIVDAIQNKTILGVMIGILMIMLTGRVLPLLSGLSDVKTLVVYDEGKSQLILGLRKQEDIRLGRMSSQAEMEQSISTAADVRLGLVLPADFDQAIAEGRSLELTGYAVHWVKDDQVLEQRTFFERALAELTGQTIHITVDEQRVYPPPDGDGFTSMATGVIVLVTITAGIFLVPYLIADEKQAKTMDALLVSPASIQQIVMGKAIAGSAYCLVTATIAVAFNYNIVVHWGAAILTVACGTAFAVGVGLLLGSLFDMPQHVNATAGVVLAVLILPIYVVGQTARLPSIIRAILPRVPSAALNSALKISLARTVPVGDLWTDLGAVLGVSAVIYAVTAWRVWRMEQ
jgi:ABC-2 type transport system permease protein